MDSQAKDTKILVVDDDAELRELIQFQLEDMGFSVDTAAHGADGLKRLRETPYDLLVSDVRMPGEIDGIDMVAIFRQERPTLKVIFVTGFAVEEKLNRALEHELSRVIKKPFLMNDLQSAVRQMISS